MVRISVLLVMAARNGFFYFASDERRNKQRMVTKYKYFSVFEGVINIYEDAKNIYEGVENIYDALENNFLPFDFVNG